MANTMQIPKTYTLPELIRYLKFYEKQGCPLSTVIEMLECDLEYVQNQSESISKP